MQTSFNHYAQNVFVFSCYLRQASTSCVRYLNCRYQGTDTSIMTALGVSSEASATASTYEQVFVGNYRREYGFELQGRAILVDDLRVRATGRWCIQRIVRI